MNDKFKMIYMAETIRYFLAMGMPQQYNEIMNSGKATIKLLGDSYQYIVVEEERENNSPS